MALRANGAAIRSNGHLIENNITALTVKKQILINGEKPALKHDVAVAIPIELG